MKFRKKPVVIEAFRMNFEDTPDWFRDRVADGTIVTSGIELWAIKTLEGEMTGRSGDWIIKGVKGEIYPCKPDIFEATYERVEE